MTFTVVQDSEVTNLLQNVPSFLAYRTRLSRCGSLGRRSNVSLTQCPLTYDTAVHRDVPRRLKLKPGLRRKVCE